MCKNNKKYLMLDCMLKFYEIFFTIINIIQKHIFKFGIKYFIYLRKKYLC